MRESLSDSSEDLYTLTTTTTNIFDFTQAASFEESEALVKTKLQTKNFFQTLFFIIRISFIGSFKVVFGLLKFSLIYLIYLKNKVLAFIHFIDVSKDKIVDTLMWRRGLLFRPATHGGVVVVAALAVIAGGLFSRGQIAAQDLTAQESILKSNNTAKTIVPTGRGRSEIVSYKVASGDTLSTVATTYGVSIETIKWANNIGDDDTLQPNQALKVPPVTGVVYTVKSGDTLDSVAKYYAADKQTVVDFPYNYIDDSLGLKVGQTLFVPNGSVPVPAPKRVSYVVSRPVNNFVIGSGLLSWPVPANISQYFSWFHQAIDIADPYGTPVYAAAGGTVIDAKKQAVSFGWYCIMDIGNGYTVAYAHMSDLACSIGQYIPKGGYIGAIGLTGRTTGPHLHFEARLNGVGVNPLSLLK